jgi:hypothetical protein
MMGICRVVPWEKKGVPWEIVMVGICIMYHCRCSAGVYEGVVVMRVVGSVWLERGEQGGSVSILIIVTIIAKVRVMGECMMVTRVRTLQLLS